MAGSLYTAIRFELRHSREYAFSIFQAPILDVADLVCCQAMHTKPKIPSAQSTRSSQPPRDFVLIGMGFGIQVNTIITMLLMLLACHPPTSKHQGFRVSCSRGLQIRVGCAGTPAAWALPPRLRHLHIEDKPTFEGHTNAPLYHPNIPPLQALTERVFRFPVCSFSCSQDSCKVSVYLVKRKFVLCCCCVRGVRFPMLCSSSGSAALRTSPLSISRHMSR